MGFSFKPSIGASGGMIMLCDTNEVDVYLTMTVDHCLAAKQ